MRRERAAGLAAGATVSVPDTEHSQDRRLGREEGWFCSPVNTQPRVHGGRLDFRRWLCTVSIPGTHLTRGGVTTGVGEPRVSQGCTGQTQGLGSRQHWLWGSQGRVMFNCQGRVVMPSAGRGPCNPRPGPQPSHPVALSCVTSTRKWVAGVS